MTRRAATTGALVALIFVFLFGPWTYATITGEPIYVDCGGLQPTTCNDAWHSWAQDNKVGRPITWVRIEPLRGTCGDYTFGHWWPFFDPWRTEIDPLC